MGFLFTVITENTNAVSSLTYAVYWLWIQITRSTYGTTSMNILWQLSKVTRELSTVFTGTRNCRTCSWVLLMTERFERLLHRAWTPAQASLINIRFIYTMLWKDGLLFRYLEWSLNESDQQNWDTGSCCIPGQCTWSLHACLHFVRLANYQGP